MLLHSWPAATANWPQCSTALALLTSTIISAVIAHWYIHSGPNTAIAGGGASAVAAASLHHSSPNHPEKLPFLGAVWRSGAAAALRSSPGNSLGTGVSILAI
jgi:hypothetical protein